MIPIFKMTPQQFGSYRRIWGKFDGIGYVFGGPRGTLAFCGAFDKFIRNPPAADNAPIDRFIHWFISFVSTLN